MTERTKLLKKAVLTSVGATSSVDRIKSALNDAMQDLVKVGNDLFSDLESKGKTKTDTVQDFLKQFQTEAGKRTDAMEKQVSTKVQTEVAKAAKQFGLATKEEVKEVIDRLKDIEEMFGISSQEVNHRRRGRRKKSSQ